jgi:hypothetical protein
MALVYFPDSYLCYCYASSYVLIPPTPTDYACVLKDGINYGMFGSDIAYGAPNTEYIYSLSQTES